MAEKFLMMRLVGKKDRLVPALLPNFLVEALDFIHDNRAALKIDDGNKFLFPNPTTKGSLDPYPLIRNFSLEFELENPKAITSTKLRHNITTAFQLVNSSQNQMKWIQVGCLHHFVIITLL